jgi:hypothetical protein
MVEKERIIGLSGLMAAFFPKGHGETMVVSNDQTRAWARATWRRKGRTDTFEVRLLNSGGERDVQIVETWDEAVGIMTGWVGA